MSLQITLDIGTRNLKEIRKKVLIIKRQTFIQVMTHNEPMQ